MVASNVFEIPSFSIIFQFYTRPAEGGRSVKATWNFIFGNIHVNNIYACFCADFMITKYLKVSFYHFLYFNVNYLT